MQSLILTAAFDFFLGPPSDLTTMHPPLEVISLPEEGKLFAQIAPWIKGDEKIEKFLHNYYELRKKNQKLKSNPVELKKGLVIEYLESAFDKPISKFESSSKEKIVTIIDQNISAPDKASFQIVSDIITWGWNLIRPLVWEQSEQGQFFTYIEEQLYGKAISHSYTNQQFYWERIWSTYQIIHLAHETNHLIPKDLILKTIPSQRKKLEIWSERLHGTWEFNDCFHSLMDLFNVYQQAYKAVVPPSLTLDTKDYTEKLSKAYAIFTEANKIYCLIPELLASFLSESAQKREVGSFTQKLEIGLNYLAQHYNLPTKATKPRPMKELLNHINENYKLKPIPESIFHGFSLQNMTAEELLKEYITAIHDDHWYTAQALAITAKRRTLTNLNWDTHYEDLELYFEDTKEILSHLTKLSNEATQMRLECMAYSSELDDKILYTDQEIFRWQKLRQEARETFLKRIKTTTNTQKGYWERISNTVKQKAIRKLLKGDFLERTVDYRTFRQNKLRKDLSIIDEKNEIIEIKKEHEPILSLSKETKHKPTVFMDKKITQNEPRFFSSEILIPSNKNGSFTTPCSLDQERPTTLTDYKKYVLKRDLTSVKTLINLIQLCNKNSNESITGYDWKGESDKVTQLLSYLKRLEILIVKLTYLDEKLVQEVFGYREILIKSYHRHLVTERSMQKVKESGVLLGGLKNAGVSLLRKRDRGINFVKDLWNNFTQTKTEEVSISSKFFENIPIFGQGDEDAKIQDFELKFKKLMNK